VFKPEHLVASEPGAEYGRAVTRTWNLAALVLLFSSNAHADEDAWWGTDKALHFGVSALVAGGGYGVSTLLVEPRWQRFGLGVSAALTVGAAKELYDASGHGDASYRDLVWDAAGGLVGASMALLLDIALDRPSESTADMTNAGAVVIKW
jgi:putative lipoprotein